jgi:hypothetical protein
MGDFYELLDEKMTITTVEQIGRHRRDYADTQPSQQPVSRGPRQIFQFIDRSQDFARARDELFSKAGEPDLSRAPFEQRRAKRILQVFDLLRH